jgi:hypothetical protein
MHALCGCCRAPLTHLWHGRHQLHVIPHAAKGLHWAASGKGGDGLLCLAQGHGANLQAKRVEERFTAVKSEQGAAYVKTRNTPTPLSCLTPWCPSPAQTDTSAAAASAIGRGKAPPAHHLHRFFGQHQRCGGVAAGPCSVTREAAQLATHKVLMRAEVGEDGWVETGRRTGGRRGVRELG